MMMVNTEACQTVALPSPIYRADLPEPSTGDAPAYPHRATITATDGRRLTGGSIELLGDGAHWTAVIRQLDAPGAVATAYFSNGVRQVLLVLGDGRRARARIAGTSFVAGGERVCRLTGIEPFAISA
jgi:hypothetical protein